MAQRPNNTIPQEVRQLRLCASLSGCGRAVEECLKESKATDMSVYDDRELGYSDWMNGDIGSSSTFVVRNSRNKNIVLLPLDNRIISGPAMKQGGVADCAILTLTDMSFVEFKTNVTSNSEANIHSKTLDAITQLWHTYDGIIRPKCLKKGIDLPQCVKIDFFIVFNKELDVTGAMASRLNEQMEFMNDHHFPLFFENEKEF